VNCCALVLATGEQVVTDATVAVPFVRVGGVALVVRAVRTLFSSAVVDSVIVLVDRAQVDATRRLLAASPWSVNVRPCDGAGHVQTALAASSRPGQPATVLVHEVNRPLTPPSLVLAVVASARSLGAVVVPVLAVSDTIKRVDRDGRVLGTEERAGLRQIQAPLAFPAELLRGPAGTALSPSLSVSGLLDRLPGPVHTVPGDPLAFGIATAWDLLVAESLT
jgi:2-C-methyl-D-erythritol 4-phosphate cytidylyltransferase